MRRRDIISLILTILLLTVTSRHWLVLKPLPVNIVARGNGDYTFVVQLNKKDSADFKRVKQCVVRKHLSGEYTNCSCEINRVHGAKRLKLIVNKTPASSPIEIKEISLKNGRCKLSTFDLKSLHGGDLLTPKNNSIELVSQDSFQVRSSIKFDAMVFIIILVLGYLLSYKLTSYLAEFKVAKHYSRLDIIFLLICVIVLFIPMSRISTEKISPAENRNLAVWKPFIDKNGQINYNFGRDFDRWFSDRFNLREELFQFYVKTFVLPNKYPCFSYTIWNKKENTFINLASSIRKFDSERVSLKLKELQRFLDERNIKLVVFIVPDREFVMDARSAYPLINPKFTSLEKIAAELSDNINIYYDIDAFRAEQEKNSLVYHNDHHYNEFGSYIVYKFLCAKLGITPVALDEYKLTKSNNTRGVDFLRKDYFNGSLIKKFPVLNQRKDLLDREYSYYDYKYQNDVKLTPIPGRRLSYEIYNPHGRSNEKLYIIHSSFGERVLQFLQANYKHIVNRRYNPVSGKDFSSVPIVEDMEKYKPDTVVIVVNACLFKDILGLKLK